jgi:GNAT superfamily N-acetyltransferase
MRSIREVCIKDHGEDEIRGWGHRPLGDRWKDAIVSGFVWVVEHDEKIFGYGYITVPSSPDESQAYIHGLYLAPEVLSLGFGKKLIHLMLEKACDAGVARVSLHSSLTGHDFYKKFGFVDAGPKMKVEIGGHPVTCIPMELRLQTDGSEASAD